MTAALRDAVAAAVAAALDERRLVGAVVAVAHRGEMALLEAYGQADRETGTPMRPDAIFLLASVTKPITSAAVLAAAERGIVDLDLPVSTWLPEFRPRSGDTAPPISLRQLLSHTSGLSYPFREAPDGPYHRARVSSGLDQPGLTADEQLRRLGSVPLLFPPGTGWNYSLSVDVAGLAAAAASGTTLPGLVEAAVTGPLGMMDTAFGVRDPARLVAHYGVDSSGALIRMDDDYAGPSTASPARFAPSRLFHPNSYPSGGGGMAGTATDVMGFFEALRNGGAPILSAASVRLMTTPALSPLLGDVLEPGWSYGLGTQPLAAPERATGPELPGAFKGSGGYGATWFVDPALELTAVALTNCAPEGVRGRLVTDLRAAIYATMR